MMLSLTKDNQITMKLHTKNGVENNYDLIFNHRLFKEYDTTYNILYTIKKEGSYERIANTVTLMLYVGNDVAGVVIIEEYNKPKDSLFKHSQEEYFHNGLLGVFVKKEYRGRGFAKLICNELYNRYMKPKLTAQHEQGIRAFYVALQGCKYIYQQILPKHNLIGQYCLTENYERVISAWLLDNDI